MQPIVTRYGGIFIYSFTVILAAGVLLGTVLTARRARTLPAAGWLDVLLLVFTAAVIGGRLGFVTGQWSYFQERPLEIVRITQGGLAYHGALFLALAALALWARATSRPFYTYAALFAPGLLLVAASGWLACWFEGCAYGQETGFGPFAGDLPDEFGVFALRYQTQLIGLALSLAALALLLWLAPRLENQVLFWLALLLLSAAHLVPGLLRGDPSPDLGPLRLDVALDGLLIALSLLMLLRTGRGRS